MKKNSQAVYPIIQSNLDLVVFLPIPKIIKEPCMSVTVTEGDPDPIPSGIEQASSGNQ